MEDENVEGEHLVELEDGSLVESQEEDLGTEQMAGDRGREVEEDRQYIFHPRTNVCFIIERKS